MSQSAGPKADHPEHEALARLEKAIGTLLEERTAARKHVADLEGAVGKLKKGTVDPVALQRRIASLEKENRGLRERIEEGREGIDRLLSRLQFLDQQR